MSPCCSPRSSQKYSSRDLTPQTLPSIFVLPRGNRSPRTASATGSSGAKLAATGPTASVDEAAAEGGSSGGAGGKMAAAARASPRLSQLSLEEMEALFEDFAVKFDKSYKDDDEKAMRFEIFKRNLKRIDEVCIVWMHIYLHLIYDVCTEMGGVVVARPGGRACTMLYNSSCSCDCVTASCVVLGFSIFLIACGGPHACWMDFVGLAFESIARQLTSKRAPRNVFHRPPFRPWNKLHLCLKPFQVLCIVEIGHDNGIIAPRLPLPVNLLRDFVLWCLFAKNRRNSGQKLDAPFSFVCPLFTPLTFRSVRKTPTAEAPSTT